MAFEDFNKQRSIKNISMISIQETGLIGINSHCYTQYFSQYEYVILRYDSETNKIGIKPVSAPAPDTYAVHSNQIGSKQISGKTFLAYYKIPHKESKNYPVTWNEELKHVEIQL